MLGTWPDTIPSIILLTSPGWSRHMGFTCNIVHLYADDTQIYGFSLSSSVDHGYRSVCRSALTTRI